MNGTSRGIRRSIVVTAAIAFVMTSLPATAAPGRDTTCGGAQKAWVPDGQSLAGRPLIVTDAATEDDPVEMTFEQPAALATGESGYSYVYVGAVVRSRTRVPKVNVRLEWPTPSLSEIDLYLYASSGRLIGESYAFNQPVVDEVGRLYWGYQGGHGYELITDQAVLNCDVLTVESVGFWTAGEPVTLKIWLTR